MTDKQFSFYLKGNEELIKFESSNKYIRILKKYIYERIKVEIDGVATGKKFFRWFGLL